MKPLLTQRTRVLAWTASRFLARLAACVTPRDLTLAFSQAITDYATAPNFVFVPPGECACEACTAKRIIANAPN